MGLKKTTENQKFRLRNTAMDTESCVKKTLRWSLRRCEKNTEVVTAEV